MWKCFWEWSICQLTSVVHGTGLITQVSDMWEWAGPFMARTFSTLTAQAFPAGVVWPEVLGTRWEALPLGLRLLHSNASRATLFQDL